MLTISHLTFILILLLVVAQSIHTVNASSFSKRLRAIKSLSPEDVKFTIDSRVEEHILALKEAAPEAPTPSRSLKELGNYMTSDRYMTVEDQEERKRRDSVQAPKDKKQVPNIAVQSREDRVAEKKRRREIKDD
jgi:hypothetical protein